MQESRADAALALLQQRLSLKVRVNGDGIWTEIAAAAWCRATFARYCSAR
jgi:hypothetical protein